MSDSSLYPGSIATCHKAMVNIFNKFNEGFNIYHFNARSLNGLKLDYFRYVFEQSTTDIVCVSETWFNCHLPDSVYDMQGFRLFRNDRTERRGGGVAVYCRTTLNAQLINLSNNSPVEYINIAISDHKTTVLVSCVYNPHRQNSLDPFFTDFALRLIDFDYYIVCGDFNVDLLLRDTCSMMLLGHMLSVGLHLVNCTIPTRRCNYNATNSLLDLLMVSDTKFVIKFDQTGFISDHDLTFCSLNIPLQRTIFQNTFTYRDYKNINFDLLACDLALVRWNDCFSFPLVDEQLHWFMNIVMNIFESHVPLKNAVIRSNSCPWFTNEVLVAIKSRNKLRNKWKNSSTSVNWSKFVFARNFANSAIKKAKLTYFQSQLNVSLTTKQLWGNLHKLKVVSKSNSECLLQPDLLNNFFTNVPLPTHTSVKSKYSNCEVEHPFNFISVTTDMVAAAVWGISSNAVGSDGLPIKFVKLCLPYLLPVITNIINHCLTTSTFPQLWKVAVVLPIPKKANALLPSDFRPISILPALAKVCERLMTEQITDYVTKHALISPFQSGFRKGHSCSTAMLKILEDIRLPFDNYDITLLCLLDFSKAFDSVNHELLCNKLVNYFHFDRSSCRLIASYLSCRLQRVKVGNNFSANSNITAGVPQGSTLGPILFSMFINDIFLLSNKVKIHAFADDVQLYLSGDIGNVFGLVACLNRELALINDWALNNMLMLNSTKSKVLPIYIKRLNLREIPAIVMGGCVLETVSKARNLGYYINSSLNSCDHINFVCGKILNILRMLRCSSEYTTQNIRRNLALQLIMPHITYFSLIFSNLDSYSSQKLNLLFNNVTRYVYGLRKFDHISQYSKLLLGVGIFDFIKIRNLIFLHGLLLSKTPQYLYTTIQRCQSNRTHQLVIPRHKHLPAERFFFVNAIRIWNYLPPSLRVITSVPAFKTAVYDYFVNIVYPFLQLFLLLRSLFFSFSLIPSSH